MSRRRSGKVVFALRSGPSLGADGDRRLALTLGVAYGALGALGGGLAYAFAGGRPLQHPSPWLDLPVLPAASLSVALGVALAFAVVVWTRFAVGRFDWAQQLHRELQPVARRFDASEIWMLALLSSVGEELFFRAFLVPTIGLAASTLMFGVLHQVKGPSRWVWAIWAASVGLALGAIFMATGSLLGPIVAHALINGTNLGFLKHHDLEPRRSIHRR